LGLGRDGADGVTAPRLEDWLYHQATLGDDGLAVETFAAVPNGAVASSSAASGYEAQFWEPLLLPTDFAALNLSSGAMSYFKPPDGSEWLAIGGHGLLLRTKDPTPTAGPTP
jgi:hypothetical protein